MNEIVFFASQANCVSEFEMLKHYVNGSELKQTNRSVEHHMKNKMNFNHFDMGSTRTDYNLSSFFPLVTLSLLSLIIFISGSSCSIHFVQKLTLH